MTNDKAVMLIVEPLEGRFQLVWVKQWVGNDYTDSHVPQWMMLLLCK